METKIRHTQRREHLESHIGLEFGSVHRVAHPVGEPGALKGLPAKRIAARPGEGVPVGDGKAQVIFHALACHHLVRVIVAERQRVGAFCSFERDFADIAEESGTHAVAPEMAG